MDIEILNEYKKLGWLMNQKHPTLPLLIWNYTKAAQYFGHWDEITINCRGLVTDLDGNVVAKGFPKFFNDSEERHTPTKDFEVFEKADGQLILVFWYAGQLVVASRGSFTSKYAVEAKRILDEKYSRFEKWARGDGLTTYCFELVGFEQVVVSYPKSDLILLGAFDYFPDESEWGEVDLHSQPNAMYLVDTNIELVKKFDGLDWRNIKQLNWKNSEGFVVRFSNGDRCKVKFADYIKLHYQMTDLSTRAIWKALKEGSSITSILEDVPDEFYDKVHVYENYLVGRFNTEKEITECYFSYFKSLNDHSRKLFVEKIDLLLTHPYKHLVLALSNGYDISESLWDYIEPKFEKL